MRRRPIKSAIGEPSTWHEKTSSKEYEESLPKRPAIFLCSLVILLLNGSWAVYHFQYGKLPVALNANQAGKRGFSEEAAMEHVKTLTSLGPHPIGSDSLDLALQYVLDTSEKIKATAHWDVDVQVDFFHSRFGANHLSSGMFKGKTLVYSDLKHVVLRILPKYEPMAEENVMLVSSHIDTVFSTEGAGDCSSCIAVMLELARGMSHWAHGFKSGIIFLFNTGEEEGLNGAHSFITQHPWRHAVRFFVDLEAMGIGGKSSIFQSGSASWAVQTFARVAKHPAGQVIAQDLFLSGVIKSATDYQVYSEIGGLSGLDFAFTDSSAVYHTKNDKLELLKPGSLQHLGENMHAFLLESAMSSHLSNEAATQGGDKDQTVFFDILGKYMVVYCQHFATLLQMSVILQAVLVWSASFFVGGFQAIIATLLSFLGIILMWILSLSMSVVVAFLLPWVSNYPAPYIANPWLIVGLFGAPAVVGALCGQHLGFQILHKYLCHVASKREPISAKLFNLLKLESERWLFKAGFLQWLIVLVLGSLYKAGSSYVALIWLISPAFAYGLIEATLIPRRSPKQLRIITLLLGLILPILVSGGLFIRLGGFITGVIVRFDRNPGSVPVWLGNIIVAVYVAAVVCLTLVYLLSYIHLSGSKSLIIISMCSMFILSLSASLVGIIPTFTNDIARAIHVVHIVDTRGIYGENIDPISYVSIFSTTPGEFTNELDNLKDEDFSCGGNQRLDLVSFTVNYGCLSSKGSIDGWNKFDVPILHVVSDINEDSRKTEVLIDTKTSTRWSLAINSQEVESFTIEANSDDSFPVDNKSDGDGWHTIQFSGGKDSPTKFKLTLSWSKDISHPSQSVEKKETSPPLLKLRTDINRITPKTARVLEKLPPWCSLFGKSTSPYTLAFLASLPVEF